MSDSLHTPHKHDHAHDHDHAPKKLTPVHDHGHAGSCCAGTPAPALVQLSAAPSAGSRLSTFRIDAMDCPTEQTLIQNKLGKLAGVQQLEFNLINRILGVTHDLPDTAPIIEAIKSLGMQADPVEEGSPTAAPSAKKHGWALALSGVGALAAEVIHFTNAAPTWVIALVAAGGLAAALSTAAGLLMAISAAVSHDLVKGVFAPDISEKNELLAGKISMAVAIVIAGYLGLNPPGFAAGTVALAFGIAASSLFPAIMMGIFSKKMNKEGAMAGMLAGLFITLFYVFAHKGIFFIKGTDFVGLIGGPNSFFGITPEAFGAIGALVNFGVAFIVDKMTKEPPEHIQALVESVRIPRGSKAVDGAH